ncbi:MAG: TetR/AcrR family transcriptional regulator [Candidatus Nanopelagicales bacterium]|jgi:AcrR family transcriptional regulator
MSDIRQGVRTRTASVEVTASLIDAALGLLEEAGLPALTVRAVATRASVAPMGVYSRFGNKDGLLEALFAHGFDTLQTAVETPSDASPLRRLTIGCLGYRQFAIDNPQLYHLMFEQMMLLELSPESREAARRSFTTLVDRVQDAMNSGDLTPGDSTEVAQQVWSAMHGAVSLEIAGVHFAQDRAESYAAMLASLFRGLAPMLRENSPVQRQYDGAS